MYLSLKGLMSEIDKSQMDRMIIAIIHLANRDYRKVVDDFIFLGFLPENVDRARIGSMLGVVLDQALQGGGAKNVNFQKLSSQLSEITFELPFQIPPYFALIIRALSVLEGIALVGDPQFKMIMEAFPYVSKRLLTDESPYLKQALREILYKNGQFSPKRLRVLVDSAQGFIQNGEAFVDFDTPPQVVGNVSLSDDICTYDRYRVLPQHKFCSFYCRKREPLFEIFWPMNLPMV